MRNVFEAILECGHDEDFAPLGLRRFHAHGRPCRLQGQAGSIGGSNSSRLPPLAPGRPVRLQRTHRRCPPPRVVASRVGSRLDCPVRGQQMPLSGTLRRCAVGFSRGDPQGAKDGSGCAPTYLHQAAPHPVRCVSTHHSLPLAHPQGDATVIQLPCLPLSRRVADLPIEIPAKFAMVYARICSCRPQQGTRRAARFHPPQPGRLRSLRIHSRILPHQERTILRPLLPPCLRPIRPRMASSELPRSSLPPTQPRQPSILAKPHTLVDQ